MAVHDNAAPHNANSSAANKARFSIGEIRDITGGEIVSSSGGFSAESEVVGVSTDTRALSPGALFIALKGENFDGHDYLPAAYRNGAVAALIEKDALPTLQNLPDALTVIAVPSPLEALGQLAAAHRRRFDIPVVAVTGSYGKTTTRSMIASALSPKYNVLTSQGNFNNEIGVPQTLLQLDESHGAAVVELGMRGAGQIEYLAQIVCPDVGVITNIGPQHIELLGSIENIAAAKAEVLRFLPESGAAVLSADDEFIDFFTDQTPAAQIVRFGRNPSAEYCLNNVTVGAEGNIAFSIHNPETQTCNVHLPLPGEHNALNASAALAVAGVLGVPLDAAARALEGVHVPGSRMRVVKSPPRGITVIDDSYNAGPNSMRAALQTLRDFPHDPAMPSRRVAVLGAMKELGDHSKEEHRGIGALAAHCAELVIGVGEETRILLEEAKAVGVIPFRTEWFPDANTAAAQILNWVREGDVVLVKGSRSVGLETVVSALAANE